MHKTFLIEIVFEIIMVFGRGV